VFDGELNKDNLDGLSVVVVAINASGAIVLIRMLGLCLRRLLKAFGRKRRGL
jgi:hypothetical protein